MANDRARQSNQESPKSPDLKQLDQLSGDIQQHILGFTGKIGEQQFKHVEQFKDGEGKVKKINFFTNYSVLHELQSSAKIAHNFAHHIQVEETLKFAQQNPHLMFNIVEIKDPHGQRMRGTPVRILAMLGDRNPFPDMKVDFGLLERSRTCFADCPDKFNKEIKKWEEEGGDATEIIMTPIRNAIETLLSEIIECEEIELPEGVNFEDLDNDTFESFLDLPFAQKFRNALKPDPNHVVTSGLVWDMHIFLDFFKIWARAGETELLDLDLNDLRSKVFAAIVLPSLQSRLSRCDLGIITKGIGNIIYKGEIPDRIDFSNPIPKCSTYIFVRHLVDLENGFIGFWGEPYSRRAAATGGYQGSADGMFKYRGWWPEDWSWLSHFRTLCERKKIGVLCTEHLPIQHFGG